jgi:hypothetical protein
MGAYFTEAQFQLILAIIRQSGSYEVNFSTTSQLSLESLG